MLDIEPLDIESEEEVQPEVVGPEMGSVALARILPSGFNLRALLAFLPDVKLKQALAAEATAALAIDVTSADGPTRLDGALARVRASCAMIKACFAEPVELANRLHKRLTGLRADFLAAGEQAIETGNRRLLNEQRRRDALAADERRRAQLEADRRTREAAQKAADLAAAKQAPAPIVEALRERAQTATAPPVGGSLTTPVLAESSIVERWRARVAGTLPAEDARPSMAGLTPRQATEVVRLMAAVVAGTAPLACFEIAWNYLDKRAVSEKSTLALPGIESYDEGGVRAKGRR